MSKSLGFTLALLVILVGLFGIAVGFGIVAERITKDFNGTMALGGVTLFATTGLALWQFDRTKRKEADARIFALRAPIYEKLVVILRDLMFETKGWSDKRDPDDLARELAVITYEMMVWGGQDTVRAVMSLSEMPNAEPGPILRVIANMFKAIRKDLGHTDDANLSEDLVVQMIRADEREKVRNLLREAIKI